MDVQELKTYLLENNKIQDVLESLGCRHIVHKNGYYICSNPDGDNKSAINVYENDALVTVNHTRDLSKVGGDLIGLVQFFENLSFPKAMQRICQWIGIDYYYNFEEDVPDCVRITKHLLALIDDGEQKQIEKPLVPINEKILSYYHSYVNDMFKNDGISYLTQRYFEIGYDDETNRITIPIRDELGSLIGVKGRLLQKELSETDLKYLYLEPCARSRILYGLYYTHYSIQKERLVYVTEAEKGVMQLWSAGFENCVATGGKKVSQSQIDKLAKLCVDVVFLFDKDVQQSEIEELAGRFPDITPVYAVVDTKELLGEKESPTDNIEKFKYLIKYCKIRIR